VKAKQKFSDSPEFDEFFRRGDEPVHGFDTLQPICDLAIDDDPSSRTLRTPEQVERRARYIKLVSVTMACLSVGSIGAFAYKAMHEQRQASTFALQMPAARHAQAVIQVPDAIRSPDAMQAIPTQAFAAPVVPADEPLPAQVVQQPSQPEAKLSESIGPASRMAEQQVRADKSEPPIPGIAVPTEALPAAPAVPESRAAKSAQIHAKLAPANSNVSKPASVASPALVLNHSVKVASLTSVEAKPSSSKPAAAKASLAKASLAKQVGAKPADYHPPTASFSD